MSNFTTDDFEPCSAAAWKQKIQVDLKGADYNKTLLTPTNEGIVIKPFYHLDFFEKLAIPKPENDFKICQKITISSEKEANLRAFDAITNGVQAIRFIAQNSFNNTVLFKNLLNKKIAFHFEFSFLDKKFITELSNYLKNEVAYFNVDIVGNLALTGNWFVSLQNDFNTLENILKSSKHSFVLGVNAAIYQNAGANSVQQVAYALAHASEYLLKFGGKAATKIQFNVATGSNYFFEIAKIRALKYLYNLIANVYDAENVNATIHSEPSLRNKTLYDYNVNMLRTTTESMSAILGGATTISNHSYNILFQKPTEFGERIAKNQLLILKEESYFNDAKNSATDSYYIEAITKEIADKALTLFKEIEKSGGFITQLKKGTIQRKIEENARKEQAQFDAETLVLLGTNKYPNEQDQMKNNLELNPFTKRKPQKTLIVPISPKRLASVLEQKRLENEA